MRAWGDRYEVDPAYFADKYGMPVGKRLERTSLLPPASGDGGDDDSQKNSRPFFD